MNYKLLHIFRNTPFGRETLFQSLYFCKTIQAHPVVYIPESDKFLMYFSNDAVQVNLDSSYLSEPKLAKPRVQKICQAYDIQPMFYEPRNYTASSLPDISTQFDYLCCPRSISDLSSKIGLGHLGPKVRRIINHAPFPVLITSPVFKPWKCIHVFFGGSRNAVNALKLGIKMAMASGLSIEIVTLMEDKSEAAYREDVANAGLTDAIFQLVKKWRFYDKQKYEQMLYDVPHDALLLLGAYGHGAIKEILFGSKMEKIQSTLCNNLLVTGPRCNVDTP